MKKILLKLSLIFAIFGAILLNSCEKEPPTPACERDNVGTVTVKNETGYSVWTDVTWGNITENYEKLLYNNGSYKYNNIPAGSIEIWVSFDGSDWYYEYESLSACEDMTYSWYLSARKASNNCPFMLMLPDGTSVVPERKIKE